MDLKVRILRTVSAGPVRRGEPAFPVGGVHEGVPCAPRCLFAGGPGMSISLGLMFPTPRATNQFGDARPICQAELVLCFPILGSPTAKVVGYLLRDRLQLEIAALNVSLQPGVAVRSSGLPGAELHEEMHCHLLVRLSEPHACSSKLAY